MKVDDRKRATIATASIVGGIGMLKTMGWVKPVVNAVVLPAHAQTSSDPTPDPAIESCRVTSSQSSVTLESVGNQILVSPIDITIENNGDVPLTSPSPNLDAGFSLIGPSFNYSIELNGGIPNPLLPGESHVLQITEIGTISCPVSDILEARFSRNGATCSAELSIVCTPAPVFNCNVSADNGGPILLVGPIPQLLNTPISVIISNTGDTPLTASLTAPDADLSISRFSGSGNGNNLFPEVTFDLNGGIPNSLQPGQSHTILITEIGMPSISQACPDTGSFDVRFSRNGAACSASISLECILPPP